VRVGECVCACGWMGRGARRTALFLGVVAGRRGGWQARGKASTPRKGGPRFPVSPVSRVLSLSPHHLWPPARSPSAGRQAQSLGRPAGESPESMGVFPLVLSRASREGKKENDAPRSPKSIFFSLSQHRRPVPPTAHPARCAASPLVPASVECVRTARLASPSRRPTHKQQRCFVAAAVAAAAPVAGVAGSYTLTQVIAVIIVG